MSRQINDLTGREFGFLVVVAYAGTLQRRRYWKVRRTLCGRTKVVMAQNLLSGRSKSCGCVAQAKARERMTLLMCTEKAAALVKQGMPEAEIKAALKRECDKAVCRAMGGRGG